MFVSGTDLTTIGVINGPHSEATVVRLESNQVNSSKLDKSDFCGYQSKSLWSKC